MFLTRSLSEKKIFDYNYIFVYSISPIRCVFWIFWSRKIWQEFFGYSDLNRDFLGYTKQSEESWYACLSRARSSANKGRTIRKVKRCGGREFSACMIFILPIACAGFFFG